MNIKLIAIVFLALFARQSYGQGNVIPPSGDVEIGISLPNWIC